MSLPWQKDPFEPERYELSEAPRYRFDLDRRELWKTLGAGIAVLVVEPALPAAAPRQGRGQDRAQTIGAFVHVDAKGAITAYTGKAEVGQDARTSLTQAVAEELRVPCSAVTLLMADTDLVPFDQGTFGSRTTPAMAPVLHRAAAAARELLVAAAAERLGVPRGELTVADGAVTHAATKRSATFGELGEGKRMAQQIDAKAPVAAPAAWTVCGTSQPKANGGALVTGAHRYPSDVTRPGMLHGKVMRPPVLDAKLKSLDAKAAEALPGVVVVRDGGFAGVVAPSAHAANKALAALVAEWEPGSEADEKDLAKTLRAPAGEGGGGRGGREGGGRGGGDERGDVGAALAKAKHAVKATFTIPYIAHAPLEPRAAVAEWSDGKLTVWTGTQRPFGVRDELVRAFRLAPEQVRVIVPDTGSGYGGKHTGDAAVEAATLARAAKRPVAVRWTREEEFTWAYFRPAGVVDVEAGVDAAGKLVAWEFHNYNSGAAGLEAPYAVADRRVRFHQSRSPLRQGSYRALAATMNHFARECCIDDLAQKAGLCPRELRQKNLADPRLRAVLDAAAEKAGWGQVPEGTGRGIACGTDKGGFVATVAFVQTQPGTKEFKVTSLVTAFECGAIVHPDNLLNQVEGAVVMGLGGALWEAIKFEKGKIVNPRFSQYRVPRFADVPELVTVLLDRKDLPSAGAGECPIVCVAPAIRNALANATGQRLYDLPLRL